MASYFVTSEMPLHEVSFWSSTQTWFQGDTFNPPVSATTPIHREYAATLIKYLPNKLMGYWKKKMNKSCKRSCMTNTTSLQFPSTKAFRRFNFQINILRSRYNLKWMEAQRSLKRGKSSGFLDSMYNDLTVKKL